MYILACDGGLAMFLCCDGLQQNATCCDCSKPFARNLRESPEELPSGRQMETGQTDLAWMNTY